MAYSAITSPHIYSNGYSFIPLRIEDTNASELESYKYIVNILYNKLTSTSNSVVNFNNNVYLKLNYATAHSYKRGEILFFDNSSDYLGTYTVMSVPTSTSVIIDLEVGVPISGTVETSNVIKYSLSPSPENDIKVDLSNTIKDFISQNLKDTNEIFEGPDTRFEYNLKCGYEGKALFQFDDNIFQSGAAGFVNTGLTATTQVDFQVGDQIIIQQDLFGWPYTDNFFSDGRVGLTGSTVNPFISSDVVTVTGQITHPSYNGTTGLFSSTSTSPFGANNIVLNKSWLGSTGVEGGIVYGIPTPEYNTTATITNIVYSAGTGVIITTDIAWAGNSPTIGGTIKHADGKIISNYNQLSLTGLNAFNSYVNHFDYSISDFDKYVIQTRANNLNYISTILDVEASGKRYRVEKDTKSWLLMHTLSGVSNAAVFQFYDSNGNILGNLRINNNTSNPEDFYIPIGVDQIIACTGKTEVIGNITGYSNNISYYHVNASFDNTMRSNRVYFYINEDCSMYEVYHLTWKDSRGSWISYPFKYVSQDTIDVDKKNYYQTPGNWSNNSFDFDSFDRGDRTFFARSRKKVLINSGWIKEFENDLIEDMMKSASVYLQLPDGTLVGCTIDNKSITLGKDLNEQIFQYQFTVIYSLDETRV
jgi:hypothetical protein